MGEWYEAYQAEMAALHEALWQRVQAELRERNPRVRARRYNVLNRNVWWNRAPMLTLFAASDSDAATALISCAGRIVEES
jgi:hypothetical protein